MTKCREANDLVSTPASYSGVPRSNLVSQDLLHILIFFVVFLSLFRQIPGYNLN
jgi:hypothetical protein